MKNYNDIEDQATTALTEYTLGKTALIGYGTGNVLSIKSRYFIVTCLHVFEILKDKNFRKIVLNGNIIIPIEQVKLLASTAEYDENKKDNEKLDIALLELNIDQEIKKAYTLDDFEQINNFANYDWTSTDLIVTGFPSKNMFVEDEIHNYIPLTLTTVPIVSKNSEDFIYAKYPVGTYQDEIQSKKKVLVKHPDGISGAFILKDKTFDGPKSEMWIPSRAKIVGIQTRFSKPEKYIKGTNIKHLFELLKKVNLLI